MEYNKFIKKLATKGKLTLSYQNPTIVEVLRNGEKIVTVTIGPIRVKDLINNIDLLAKELHMEVEEEARRAQERRKKTKYKMIGTGLVFEKDDVIINDIELNSKNNFIK